MNSIAAYQHLLYGLGLCDLVLQLSAQLLAELLQQILMHLFMYGPTTPACLGDKSQQNIIKKRFLLHFMIIYRDTNINTQKLDIDKWYNIMNV